MAKEKSEFSGLRVSRDLARLFSGELSADDARKISQSMEADKAYQDDFLKISAALSDPAGLRARPGIRAALDDISTTHLNNKPRTYWFGLAAVAGFILIAVVGIALWTGSSESDGYGADVTRYVTRVGEQKTIDLADGSTLTLNTGTQALVDITDTYRRVILERGEAFFDIAPDPQRPFTVDLDAHSVTVLGTAFNIFKKPDAFNIAVVEGLVALHKKGDPVSPSSPLLQTAQGEQFHIASPDQNRLQAGWVAEFDAAKNTLTGYRPPNMDRLHSWRTGIIRFEEIPLYEVIQELNRYSGKKILIEDKAIMDLTFYGAIRVDRLNTAVKGLEQILPVKVTHYHDRTTIVGK